MSVRADSKGRLTGAIPGGRYVKKTSPDGTITFSPAPITEFDDTREVTESQFEEFFGVRPGEVPENQGIVTYRTGVLDPGYLPVGIVVTQFVTDSDGSRRIVGGVPEKKRTLIRILRD